MKRYRYGSQKQGSMLQKARPILIMFIGWNLIGFVAWKFLNSRMAQNDPAWEARSETERIAALTGSSSGSSQSAKYKKYSFFSDGKKDSDS